MIKWLAQLTPASAACENGLMPRLDCQSGDFQNTWHIERRGTSLWLGREEDGNELIRLATVRQLMQIVDQCAAECTATMGWAFSPVMIPASDLSSLLRRWDETAEPPVLSIIDLQIGDAQHVTSGLKAFIGHEIAAHFDEESKSREAARNLARLSRHALMHGHIDILAQYFLPDGEPLAMTWSSAPEPGMVTIVL